ncbi:MAG: WG repeat-containing protein [Clostridia bacterium]|nr:WG repeat-containing protein [Clostridia bacterium]
MKRVFALVLVIILLTPAAFAEGWVIQDVGFLYGKYINIGVYESVEDIPTGHIQSHEDRMYGIIDINGNTIVEPRWDSCGIFADGLAKVSSEDEGLLGYVDENGELMISFFETDGVNSLWDFCKGYALIEVNGLWGYINTRGEIVIEPKYEMGFWRGFEPDMDFEDKHNFSEGLAAVVLDGKYGYIDTNGAEVIPFIYDEAYMFEDGQARVRVENRWGVIDTAGNWVINPEWEEIEALANGAYCVYIDDECGIVDRNGSLVLDVVYNGLDYDHEINGYIISCDSGYGTADAQGNIIIDPIYDSIDNFICGYAFAVKDGKAGLIDVEGNEITGFVYGLPIMSNPHIGDGYRFMGVPKVGIEEAWVKEDFLYGVLDPTGNVIAEPVYEDIGYRYSENLINVCKDGKWGYIDRDGNNVIECIYDDAWQFGGGVAPVKLGDKVGLIDTEGNVVVDFVWDDCEYIWVDENYNACSVYEWEGEIRFVVAEGAARHVIDNSGNVIR